MKDLKDRAARILYCEKCDVIQELYGDRFKKHRYIYNGEIPLTCRAHPTEPVREFLVALKE